MYQVRREHKTIEGVEHKWCSGHKEWHPLTAFGLQTAAWDRLHGRCKLFDREQQKEFQEQYRKKVQRLARELNIPQYKLDDCPNKYRPSYHHRDASKKVFTIAHMFHKSDDEIRHELAKCDEMHCDTCHKIIGHGPYSRKDYYTVKKWMEDAVEDVARRANCSSDALGGVIQAVIKKLRRMEGEVGDDTDIEGKY